MRANPSNFKSPVAFGFDDYWDYGHENQTASANYRPGNSNTVLRKPRARIASGKPASSTASKPSGSRRAQPDSSLGDLNSHIRKTPQAPEHFEVDHSQSKLKDGPLIEFSPIDDSQFYHNEIS